MTVFTAPPLLRVLFTAQGATGAVSSCCVGAATGDSTPDSRLSASDPVHHCTGVAVAPLSIQSPCPIAPSPASRLRLPFLPFPFAFLLLSPPLALSVVSSLRPSSSLLPPSSSPSHGVSRQVDANRHRGRRQVQAQEVPSGVQEVLPRGAHGQAVHRGGAHQQAGLDQRGALHRMRHLRQEGQRTQRPSMPSSSHTPPLSSSPAPPLLPCSHSVRSRPSRSSTCPRTWSGTPPTATAPTPSSCTDCPCPGQARCWGSWAPTASVSPAALHPTTHSAA